MSDFSIDADFKAINNAKEALGEFTNSWASAVTKIVGENRRLEKAVQASANSQNEALDRVLGAQAQRDLENWAKAAGARHKMMQKSAEMARKQSEAEAKAAQEIVDNQQKVANAFRQSLEARLGLTNAPAKKSGATSNATDTVFKEVVRNQGAQSEDYWNRFNLSLGIAQERATQLGASYSQLGSIIENEAAQSKQYWENFNNTIGSGKSKATELGASFSLLGSIIENEALQAKSRWEDFNRSIGITAPKATQMGAGFGALEEMEKLKAKYNPAAVAADKYEKEVLDIKRAHEIGVITSKQMRGELDQLEREYRQMNAVVIQSSNHMNQFGGVASFSGKRLNRFGMVAQQAGYQVGDSFVQVASGQSALVAFGQQGAQLAGIFGPGGAVIGALIAIGTAIAIPFVKGRKKNEEFVDSLEDTIKKIGQLENEARLARVGIFDSDEGVLYDRRLEAQQNLNAYMQEHYSLTQAARLESERGYGLTVTEMRLRDEGAAVLRQELSDAQALIDRRNQALEILEEERRAQQEKEDAIQAALDALDDMIERQRELTDEIGKAGLNALKLAGVDIYSPISAAAMAAAQLAGNLGVALNTALSIQNMRESKTYSGRGGDPRTSNSSGYGAMDQFDIDEAIANHNERLSRAVRSGGGGRSSKVGGGSRSSGAKERNPIEDILKEIQRREQLLGLTENQRKLIEEIWSIEDKLGETRSKFSNSYIESLAQQNIMLEKQEDAYQKSIDALQAMGENIERTIGDSISSIKYDFESLSDAAKSAALSISRYFFENQIMPNVVGGFDAQNKTGSGLTGLFMNAIGGIMPFAKGGVVNSPTYFSNNGRAAVAGEAGPEAILPLARGRDGKMGVQGGGNTTYNFNISTPNPEAFRKSMPQIANEMSQRMAAGRRNT